jgi:hypothetical protein
LAAADDKLWIGSDNYLTFKGARDSEALPGVYLNNGTVVATIHSNSPTGTQIGSSIPLDYVPGSDGDYVGVIDRSLTLTLTEGVTYFIVTIFNEGSYDDMRVLEVRAEYRRCSESGRC